MAWRSVLAGVRSERAEISQPPAAEFAEDCEPYHVTPETSPRKVANGGHPECPNCGRHHVIAGASLSVSFGVEGDVTYFCFIESSILSVPHMEPLAADDPHVAKIEAEALLRQHGSGYAAHVFEGNRRIATVRRDGDRSNRALDQTVRA